MLINYWRQLITTAINYLNKEGVNPGLNRKRVSIPVIARSSVGNEGVATKQSLHTIFAKINREIVLRDCFGPALHKALRASQ